MKLSIRTRLKIAWQAFNLQSFELICAAEPKAGRFFMFIPCDNHLREKCLSGGKQAMVAYYEYQIQFLAEYKNPAFICTKCANNNIITNRQQKMEFYER